MGNKQCCASAPNDEQISASLQTHQAALLALSTVTNGVHGHGGTGILVHRTLVLTSHGCMPDPDHAVEGELSVTDDGKPVEGKTSRRILLTRKLLPSRQFITNAGLDATLVAFETVNADQVAPLRLGLKEVAPKVMDKGHRVFILGHHREEGLIKTGVARITDKDEYIVKFKTEGDLWAPGSAGFDETGEFAFMVCHPKNVPGKKEPTEKKERGKQSGILVRVLCRWLKEYLGANFNELVQPAGPGSPAGSPGDTGDAALDPLPDFYTSQTVPIKKQPWLAPYEKIIPPEVEPPKVSTPRPPVKHGATDKSGPSTSHTAPVKRPPWLASYEKAPHEPDPAKASGEKSNAKHGASDKNVPSKGPKKKKSVLKSEKSSDKNASPPNSFRKS